MPPPRAHLTIVCCHAIYRGNPGHDPFEECNWILKPFQGSDAASGRPGEHNTFVQHIQRAVQCWQQHANSALVFSGGATERPAWHGSEAASYLNALTEIMPELKGNKNILLEEHATDSYQNVLFSLLEYNTRYSAWPDSLTIVSHAFKRHRLVDLHAKAIKWPIDRIGFQGIDPPMLPDITGVSEERCCRDWERDMYGVRDPLHQKRVRRGFDESAMLHSHLDPRVRDLVRWDGGSDPSCLFPGELPWEEPRPGVQ